jgi:S1/P1 Nuclease
LRAILLILLYLWSRAAFGYGPTGHEIVGGIADKLLANTVAGARVRSLIDGMTLEKAAVIADEVKAWDKNGPDDPSAFPNYSDHPKIDKQLREFWRANQPTPDPASPMPSHHWFHYTDVPVLNAQKYAAGQTGRSQWDIVHMIPYCIAVLRGEMPGNNPRKITKAVAVILLAHYVGDIHQPLHVGAEYFDANGRAVDPDRGKKGIEDEGGNTIMLRLYRGTADELAKRGLKLHGFWDNEAVLANLPSAAWATSNEQRNEALNKAKRQLIEQLARKEPANWQMDAGVSLKNYAEIWADEILPIAREAHERLRFLNIYPQLDEGRTVAAGIAEDKTTADGVAYADWAAKIVREELHKAGWRLADLLTQALTSSALRANPTAQRADR